MKVYKWTVPKLMTQEHQHQEKQTRKWIYRSPSSSSNKCLVTELVTQEHQRQPPFEGSHLPTTNHHIKAFRALVTKGA